MKQFPPNIAQSMGLPPQGLDQVQMTRSMPKQSAKPSAFDRLSWVTVVLLAFVAILGFLWKYGYLIGGPR